jgi:hypothetical protein
MLRLRCCACRQRFKHVTALARRDVEDLISQLKDGCAEYGRSTSLMGERDESTTL